MTRSTIFVLGGRDVGRSFDIEGEAVLGRDDSCQVKLVDRSISRKHARVFHDGLDWVVEDLGSSNGTFLKGAKIEGPQSIGLGDEIGLGKFSIIFGKALGEGEVPVATPSPRPPSRVRARATTWAGTATCGTRSSPPFTPTSPGYPL